MKNLIFIIVLFSYCNANAQSVASIWKNDPIITKNKPSLEALFASKSSKLGNAVYFRVFKQTNTQANYGELEIWAQQTGSKNYVLIQSYPICYFSGGLGTKEKQGDGKTPEGFYSISANSLNRYSSYLRAFNIGYPNQYDQSHNHTGGLIMIHGNCASIGCIAMTDAYIEPIWTIGLAALQNGQKRIEVHIFPFAMTDENMNQHANSTQYQFWQMLAPAYTYFEQHKQPPVIKLVNKNYLLAK